jgi:hypothetical protein
MGEKTFWTDARRRLIAKTLANLFLLLIGAAATGEVVLGFAWWLKVVIAGVILLAGVLAVVVTPDAEGGNGG